MPERLRITGPGVDVNEQNEPAHEFPLRFNAYWLFCDLLWNTALKGGVDRPRALRSRR